MYEHFYQLKKAPFRITPAPEFLYLSPSHKEAVASIVFGVEQRKGFIVVLGEVGLGKTTILRRYLARHDAKRMSTAYVFNANVGFKDLLDTIYRELGIADKPDDVAGMVSRLHDVVIEEYRQRRNVVLVIDEAQNLPVETLENLRVLSNLETSTDKLIQIVLLGQPEFAAKLDLPELRQLKQRVAVRCTLSPFTDAESQAYIEHRLKAAGSTTRAVFTTEALRDIVKHAKGIPRVLNVLCDSALVTGLGYRARPVTAAIVREVIRDLEGKPRMTARRRRSWAPLAALLVMGAALSGFAHREFTRPAAPREAALPVPAPPTVPIAAPASARPVPWESRELPSVPAAAQPVVATRVVRKGDTLLRLALDVYGFPVDEVFQRVRDRNPGISNVNWILAGTEIRFPDVSDLKAQTPGPSSHRPQRP